MNIEEHPWFPALQNFKPQPMPAAAQWSPIEWQDAEGTRHVRALLTIATPGGVNTIFLEQDVLRILIEQGIDILKMWKAEESKLIIARPEDMKREVRAQSLVDPTIKNGHKFS